MNRIKAYLPFILIFLLPQILLAFPPSEYSWFFDDVLTDTKIESLYHSISPAEIRPSLAVFSAGVTGFRNLFKEGRLENSRYLTLIDFTLSSRERRLWVIDLHSLAIKYHTLVAHGKNTGEEYAVKFSNTPNSNMSSLGFYVTGKTYYGQHGFSLILEGVEKGINDKARERAIVIHPADYVSTDFIKRNNRLGRSFGCPALPPEQSKGIIETIQDNSCLFIYFTDNNYLMKSPYLNNPSGNMLTGN